jgi:GTPase SAR1 family protein
MDVRSSVEEHTVVMLIANKTDLSEARVISSEVGEKFAKDNHCLYGETSAKNGINVDDVFKVLISYLLANQ